MADKRQSDINSLASFFEERLAFVKLHCLDEIEGMILLCSYIDSLSGYRYGGSGKAKRFKKFLTECTEQSDEWRKVSLILLRQDIERRPLTIDYNIIGVLDRLKARTKDFIFVSNHNPDIPVDELMHECGRDIVGDEGKFRKVAEQFEYSKILWRDYRNAAVHDTYVRMSEAMNDGGHCVPYYLNQAPGSIGMVGSAHMRFAIPSRFLVATIESGLHHLRNDTSGWSPDLPVGT